MTEQNLVDAYTSALQAEDAEAIIATGNALDAYDQALERQPIPTVADDDRLRGVTQQLGIDLNLLRTGQPKGHIVTVPPPRVSGRRSRRPSIRDRVKRSRCESYEGVTLAPMAGAECARRSGPQESPSSSQAIVEVGGQKYENTRARRTRG